MEISKLYYSAIVILGFNVIALIVALNVKLISWLFQ